jgi:hypothetical protein
MKRRVSIHLGLTAGILTALSACQSSFERKDTLGYAAGDAVAWNRTVHTIDPWPAASADTTIPVSGRRVAAAIERYETGGSAPVAAAPQGLVPLVPIAPGPTP